MYGERRRGGRASHWAALLLGAAGTAAAAPITLVQHDPAPSVVGQSIVVSTRIDPPSGPQPTGIVTISDGVDSCTARLPQGYCLWTPSTSGTRTLTASYPGDGNFSGSSASVAHFVEARGLPERVSVGTPLLGYDLVGASPGPRTLAFSGDGRFVAFLTNVALVPEDDNLYADAYVLDRHSGMHSLVSVDSAEARADGNTNEVAISADGRFVAFASQAANLVAGDTNGMRDVFLRDRSAGTTVRVSVSATGAQSNLDSHEPDVSADGRRVAFKSLAALTASDGNGAFADVFVRDLDLGTTLLVSVNPSAASSFAHSYTPTISDDGTRVAFLSEATNLVGSDSNGTTDVFVRDLVGASTELASVDGTGGQVLQPAAEPELSPDGSQVLFRTGHALDPLDVNATFDCYVRDVLGNTTALASQRDDESGTGSVSGVNACAFAGDDAVWFISAAADLVSGADESSSPDLFRRDNAAGSTTRITAGATDSVSTQRLAGSDDGRQVGFDTSIGLLVPGVLFDPVIYDRIADAYSGLVVDRRGNQSDEALPAGGSGGAATSADGRYVAFLSTSHNLYAGKVGMQSDVFVRDRSTGTTERVSVALDGGAANGVSIQPAISADGRHVAFASTASNLVAADGNGRQDIFVRDLLTDTTLRVSVDPAGADADDHSHRPSLSADGRYVVFDSNATDLLGAGNDGNGVRDIFRWDRTQPAASAIVRASVSEAEAEANGESSFASVSLDGDFVVFQSEASNLTAIAGPAGQVFVRSIGTASTTQLSTTAANGPPNGISRQPVISGDGNFVAFWTTATNLGPAAFGGQRLLRRALVGGSYDELVDRDGQAVGVADDQYANLSDDGRYLALVTAFQLDPADTDPGINLNVYDFELGTGRVVLGRDGSEPQVEPSRHSVALSGDGTLVTARAESATLVAGDTNGVADLYLFENPAFGLELEQQVETLSANADDSSLAPASDASGRYIVFQSEAGNLAPGDVNGASDIFRVDTETGATVRLSLNDDGSPLGADSVEPSVSADGSAVLFVSADAGITKVFGETRKKTLARAKGAGWSVLLRNLVTGTTQRLAAAQPGGSGTQPRIAPAAGAIVYSAPNPDPLLGVPGQVEVFHLPLQRVGANLVPGAPRCVSCKAIDANGQDTPQNSDGPGRAPALSANGEWIAWQSEASNPLPAVPSPCPNVSTAVLLRNLITGAAQRISVPAPSGGCGPNGTGASAPGLDWSGRTLVFTTDQPLLPDDDDGFSDAYVFDLERQRLLRVSQTAAGTDANGDTTGATISGDGRQVAFVSAATNLDGVEADTNAARDTHVATLAGGAAAVRRLSRTRTGAQADSHSQRPALNYNGTRLAFDSDAGNLAPGAEAGVLNVFQRANPLNGDTVFVVGFE
jgi:Tol biopolymer transport system component